MSQKKSLETQKRKKKSSTESTQIFTARGGEDAITLIQTLAQRQLDENAHKKPTRGVWTEVGSETKDIRFVYCKKGMCD